MSAIEEQDLLDAMKQTEWRFVLLVASEAFALARARCADLRVKPSVWVNTVIHLCQKAVWKREPFRCPPVVQGNIRLAYQRAIIEVYPQPSPKKFCPYLLYKMANCLTLAEEGQLQLLIMIFMDEFSQQHCYQLAKEHKSMFNPERKGLGDWIIPRLSELAEQEAEVFNEWREKLEEVLFE